VLRITTDNSPASEWFEKDDPLTLKSISEWLLDITDADNALVLLQSRIKGDVNYYSTIELSEYGSEIFVWTDAEYNVKQAIWSGTAVNAKGAFLNETSQTTDRASGANVIDPGDIDSVVIPVAEDSHRSDTTTFTGGGDTVSFGSTFVDASLYTLMELRVLDNQGNPQEYTITANDEDGFTIYARLDGTVKYLAMKNK
jgi:hypothetical protein